MTTGDEAFTSNSRQGTHRPLQPQGNLQVFKDQSDPPNLPTSIPKVNIEIREWGKILVLFDYSIYFKVQESDYSVCLSD
ncbi:MAG: hypothetical protein CL912_07530 [Deltaproteobacteria bacterium]|nr:hypothetical protein [Deltaproteobacteria bacterium]